MYELSILIPARNEEFLKRTIEDILENIEAETEIIAVLDGYETELPKDSRLTIIHNPESKGQRGSTNQACRLSLAKYVMKVDAHCAFDKGFDRKMIEVLKEAGDNVTMVPIMRNLHAFNWVCPDGHIRYQSPSGPCNDCGKPTEKDICWIAKTNPASTSYCFDEEPHFQYFRAFKKRSEYKKDFEEKGLTETMSLQGSCFMMTREKYWELNISDESFGSWGSQGIEVACKTWLSGGRVLVNHKTWYAHMFRTQGGDFGFPYPQSGRQVGFAKKTAKELFFDNKWEKQTRPLSWLIERFWPVPGWTEEMRARLKVWPLQNQKIQMTDTPEKPKEIQKQELVPSEIISQEENIKEIQTCIQEKKDVPVQDVGIIYYTDNSLDEKLMKICQRQLKKAAGEKGIEQIVSVSLQPIGFGRNTVLPLEPEYITLFKQILVGLESLDAEIVFFCEHDVLYHPSHFDFRPSKKDIWSYNGNHWFLRSTDGFALNYKARVLSGLCVNRDIAITHYHERIKLVEREGYSNRIGIEPMTHKRIEWEKFYPHESFVSASPNINIKHGKTLASMRWRQEQFRQKPDDWREADIDTIPGWDNVRKLLNRGGIKIG
ncbi:glycosyltransferase family 2 protein [Patescibacteria group bacterium]